MRLGSILVASLALLVAGLPAESLARGGHSSVRETWELEIPLEEGFRRLPPAPEGADRPEPARSEEIYADEDPADDPPVRRVGGSGSVFERYAQEVVGDQGGPKQPGPSEQRRVVEEHGSHRVDAPAARGRSSEQVVEEDSERPSEDELVEGDETPKEGEASSALARHIRKPTHARSEIYALWEIRRSALLDLNKAAADRAMTELLSLKEDLGIVSIPHMALAVVREGKAQLGRKDAKEALTSANLALELSPHLPPAHWLKARAIMANEPTQVHSVLSAALRAVSSDLFGMPRGRAHAVNSGANLALGLLFGGLLALLLIVGRKIRLYLHDLHHLFPRGAARFHTSVLGLAILATPLVLRVGAAGILCVVAAAAWLHASWRERAVIAVVLATSSLSPHVASLLVRHAEFFGTPAEHVYRLEREEGRARSVRALENRVDDSSVSWQELFALARHHKRGGELERASELYLDALAKAPRVASVHNNLGVVLYAEGDLEGARASFRRATELESNLAVAWHNLSKVHFRLAEAEAGREARRRAVALDGAVMDRYPDFEDRLNLAMADVGLSDRHMMSLVNREASFLSKNAVAEVSARLSGAIPSALAAYLPIAMVPVLVLLGFVTARWRPSKTCSKCGRSVCFRCDPEVGSGLLCGQCLTVFQNRAEVSPRVRMMKEAGVRRYQGWASRFQLGMGLILPGSAQVLRGEALRGLLFLAVFSAGVASIVFRSGPLPAADVTSPGPQALNVALGTTLLISSWVLANLLLRRKVR